MQRIMGLAVGRWSIYIDLEGFGDLYDKENQVLVSLGVLMEGIFQIGRIRLGRGVMTLFPVMGSALIRAFSVIKNCPSGPLLAIASAEQKRLPAGLVTYEVPKRNLILVDWVHSQSELASWITDKAGLKSPNSAMVSELLSSYCQKHNVRNEWSKSVSNFLGVAI